MVIFYAFFILGKVCFRTTIPVLSSTISPDNFSLHRNNTTCKAFSLLGAGSATHSQFGVQSLLRNHVAEDGDVHHYSITNIDSQVPESIILQ